MRSAPLLGLLLYCAGSCSCAFPAGQEPDGAVLSPPAESVQDPCTFSGTSVADAYVWATWTAVECTERSLPAQVAALAHALDTLGFTQEPLVPRVTLHTASTSRLFALYPRWEQAPFHGAAWTLARGLAAGAVDNPVAAACRLLLDIETALVGFHDVAAPPVLSPSRSSAKTTDAAFWQQTINDLRAERAYLEAQ